MDQDIYVVIEHLRGQVTDISYVMLAAGRELTDALGSRLIAVLLGHNAQELANDLAADQVLYMDDLALAEFNAEACQQALAMLLNERQPRAVLLGDTTIGAEIAGPLSAKLGIPIVTYCRSLLADGEAIRFISQICGGKILVEGNLPTPMALVGMIPGGYGAENGRGEAASEILNVPAPEMFKIRTSLKKYIEPEAGDVDISKENLLVAVGRGIQNQDNLEMVEQLAQALGGVVCSSRPVVDQGWLPISRLVGKSGQRVKPKVYLALGISGAPEHVEAITASEMIIAVNTDPAAPIFDLAQYGVEADMFDLLPVLTDALLRVQQN